MSHYDLPIVQFKAVEKNFGLVKALDQVDFEIFNGECIGLVGHNGAGKSTLMNILAGTFCPSYGDILINGQMADDYSVLVAQKNGIRCVFQELSLCPNLSVAENTRVMHASIKGFGWQKKASTLILQKLDDIFPNHSIKSDYLIADLSISQRQMVEISRVFSVSDTALNVVILDEPTSSLDAIIAKQLLTYVRKYVEQGGACVLISHMLDEILNTSDRIIVMCDGKIITEKPAQEFNRNSLVAAMGSVIRDSTSQKQLTKKTVRQGIPVLDILPTNQSNKKKFQAYKGEIIGLAGLAGHGQTDMLLQLFSSKNSMSFIAGDRQNDGVFPQWSIAQNISIGSIKKLLRYYLLDRQKINKLAEKFKQKIAIKTPDLNDNILTLSGGNQQKVLFARALGSPSKIILMDDPMRGVDIGTKQDVYDMIKQEAADGRVFIWYTTEFEELKHCDHIYIFSENEIVADLSVENLSEEVILQASFKETTI